VGAIGAGPEVMEEITSGRYEQVGTMNGNPLTMAAARAMLTEVMTPATYEHLGRLKQRMNEGVQRIIDRQAANSWSYDRDVAFVEANGGQLATTPNGMLMGLGGNGLQDLYSEGGGTTWGDIFMLNIDDPDDPAAQLRQIVQSGDAWYPAPDGNGRQGSLDLDRLLHHEERHSQQWAEEGYPAMVKEYGWEWLREKAGHPNRLEEDAGPSDGGYR